MLQILPGRGARARPFRERVKIYATDVDDDALNIAQRPTTRQ
jgi:chemotaxis methyl-accepting protein methylase